MSLELETCYECFALTDNLRDHTEWHKKMNELIEKVTGIHPVCLEGHVWQHYFGSPYACGRCGQEKEDKK